jgi:hypothetical protein
MPAYKARIYANVTNTKYSNGEGTPQEIIATMNLSEADASQVLTAFYVIRPELIVE